MVSPRVAAELAGVNESSVRDLIRAGKVRSERIKGELYVSLDDVLAEGGAR